MYGTCLVERGHFILRGGRGRNQTNIYMYNPPQIKQEALRPV